MTDVGVGHEFGHRQDRLVEGGAEHGPGHDVGGPVSRPKEAGLVDIVVKGLDGEPGDDGRVEAAEPRMPESDLALPAIRISVCKGGE